jgi:hypothetical protein
MQRCAYWREHAYRRQVDLYREAVAYCADCARSVKNPPGTNNGNGNPMSW